MKSLFFIHKKNKYHLFHSTFYVQLQKIFKNINQIKDDLSSPPPNVISTKGFNELNPLSINQNTKNLENNNIEFSTYIDISTIDELDIFLKEKFKIIEPKNELENFKILLKTLRGNILGRKIRVAFIGNISVGKSTVLNCIIGKDILPAKDSECTYRGIIILYKNIDNYRLKRTKLIKRGKGIDEYYFFNSNKIHIVKILMPLNHI